MERKSIAGAKRPLVVAFAIGAVAIACAIYFGIDAYRQRSVSAARLSLLDAAQHKLEIAQAEAKVVKQRLKEQEAHFPIVADTATRSPIVSATANLPILNSSAVPNVANGILNSPSFRASLRQAHLATVRPIYDPLLEQLNLSPEQRDKFYELYLGAANPTETLEKPISDASTPEERAQLQAQLDENRKRVSLALAELLGDQGFNLYEKYRETEGTRMLAQQFRQQVDNRTLQFTQWQFDRLQDILIQTQPQQPAVGDDFIARYQIAISQAEHILTPQQLDAFRSYLNNRAEMSKAVQALIPKPNK